MPRRYLHRRPLSRTSNSADSPPPRKSRPQTPAVESTDFLSSLKRELSPLQEKKPSSHPHVGVNAGAGCGKTSTMEAGYNAIMGRKLPFAPSDSQQAIIDQLATVPSTAKMAFLAFNHSIAEEFKVRGLPGRTFHSFGFAALRNGLPATRFGKASEWKTTNILERQFQVTRGSRGGAGEKGDPALVMGLGRLVSLCKNTLAGLTIPPYATSLSPQEINVTPEEIMNLVDHFSLDIDSSTLERAMELINPVLRIHVQWLMNGELDFDDMIWGPLVLGLPIERHDLLLVDECQDLNSARMLLAQLAGDRIVTVGDKNQAIYGFTGADAAAFQNFQTWMSGTPQGGKFLPLMETRRCPQEVVSLVNDLVPDFKALPEAPRGTIIGLRHWDQSHPGYAPPLPWDVLVGDKSPDPSVSGNHPSWADLPARPGDMILCPMNAPLVSLAYRMIRHDKRVTIQGRDIGNGLISLISKAQKSGASSLTDVIGYVLDYQDSERAKLLSNPRCSESQVQALEDKCSCILYLTEGLSNVGELINRIGSLFEDCNSTNSHNRILLSSVHKAKGLEARRVFIIKPEFLPPPWGKKDWELQQGRNLRYVAFTRTKDTLVGCLTPDKEGRD